MASPRDYKNTIIPNWCPGCGDYGIQNAISAVCAKKGWANEDITLISGIGCSSATSTATALIPPTAEPFPSHRASSAQTRIPI